jgi:hypothetical protein
MNFIECYGIEEKLLFLQALMRTGHCHFHVQFVRDEAGINKPMYATRNLMLVQPEQAGIT